MLTSTFMINHFELLGLHQVANHLTDHEIPATRFRTPLFYELVQRSIDAVAVAQADLTRSLFSARII